MPQHLSRRSLLGLAGASVVTAAGGYSMLVEPSELRIEQVKVETDLPAGLRIGALSDFHLCDTISRTRVETAARKLARQKPDLIVLLGDYSTAMHSESVIHGNVETALEILSSLQAPLGVYGIVGNHDVTPQLTDIANLMTNRGITPLIDASTVLTIRGEKFAIVGLSDAVQTNPNPYEPMRGVPKEASVLGLIHEPDAAPVFVRSSIVLSGHSHGGQVRLPGGDALVLPTLGRRFPWGLRRDENVLVYTTRGVGMVPPRIRINCPPEVTIIEIVRAHGRVPMPPVT